MMKGKYIRTEKIKKKISQSLKNKHPSEKTRKKMSIAQSGKNNSMYGRPSPNKGKHLSEKHKQRISESQKGKRCGDKNSRWGKRHSEQTKQKIKETHMGANNPQYIDGRSFLPYCSKFNNQLREFIRQRDNYTCQLCGKIQNPNDEKLSVHHIHYDKENCYPDLITLCKSCNSKVNFNKEYYESFFMNNLNERSLLFWVRRILN